ncbi:ATP-dependent DNA helicase RecQ-like [Mercenaria mercenaria]|uniref:ATP-dependent DNA helicase RecQ-like n=1 Tax=Mercenaria mercenaria TaxID=6596 RepID=UPI00234F2955|nr:ATP-dependent DNA helicase RecQ-like [Mercenaria mercenaria]
MLERADLRTPELSCFILLWKTIPENIAKTSQLKEAILSNFQKPDGDCHIRLIFSTVALGMGADLKQVKRVIHARPPTSLETYVQEIGRAGRTGSDSQAILYFNRGDLASGSMRKEMKEYCTV